MDQALEPTHEQPEPGWEYLLFASELRAGLQRMARRKWDYENGVRHPSGVRIHDADAAGDDLRASTDEAAMTVANVERLFDPAVMDPAWGAPGEPGDEAHIRYVAAGICEIYDTLLAWADRLRGTVTPKSFEAVYWALSMLVELPLLQIEDFVDELGIAIEGALEAAREGELPDEPIRLDLRLALSISDHAMGGYKSALDAATR